MKQFIVAGEGFLKEFDTLDEAFAFLRHNQGAIYRRIIRFEDVVVGEKVKREEKKDERKANYPF